MNESSYGYSGLTLPTVTTTSTTFSTTNSTLITTTTSLTTSTTTLTAPSFVRVGNTMVAYFGLLLSNVEAKIHCDVHNSSLLELWDEQEYNQVAN